MAALCDKRLKIEFFLLDFSMYRTLLYAVTAGKIAISNINGHF